MASTRRKPGRLGAHVEGYRARLLSLGHTPGTVRGQLRLFGQLGRWMSSHGVEPEQLNIARVEAFLTDQRADGHTRVPTLRSFSTLLAYLADAGVVAAEDAPASSGLDDLLLDYGHRVRQVRDPPGRTLARQERLGAP